MKISEQSLSEYAGDGYPASERGNGIFAHAHGNGRVAQNSLSHHEDDGDAHLDHAGADVDA
jgi:hypothetical protein